MKLRLLLFIYCLLLACPVMAQSFTATIGTATTNPAGSDSPFSNIATSATYSRFAGKYHVSSIAGGGGTAAGLLKKIRWYKTTSAAVNNAGQQLRIYVKEGQFNWNPGININWATEVAGATLVYSNNNQDITAGTGWKEFELSTPFTWTRTSGVDLAIFVEWHNPGPTAPALKWAAPSNTNAHYMQNANGYPNSLMNGGASRLPSTQLVFDPLQQNDAGISAVLNPGTSGLQTGVATPVEVRLANFGSNTITSATVNWSVNGVAGTPFAYTGSLASLAQVPVTIGSHAFTAGLNTIKAWTSNPNGATDPVPANDTVTIQVEACTPMAGLYTIVPGSVASPTNFNSLAAAIQTLKTCGVGGAVTFTLAANTGPYTEAIELTHIPGASPANTITLNGQGNMLEPAPVFGEAAVIKLDSASHIVITDFNLLVSNTTLGYGIQLINHSDSVTIANCTITVPQVLSPSVYGILIGNINSPSNTPRSRNVTIVNNTIIGGESGIIVNQYAGNLTGTDAANLLISGNAIKDFRQYGIKLFTVQHAIITKNDISRPNRVAPFRFFGIHFSGNNTNCQVEKNRIHNPVGGVPAGSNAIEEDVTGIFVSGDATVGAENLIVNNLIYDLNNAGNTYGIYNNGSDGTYIYHNTINLEKSQQTLSPSVVAGFYQTTAASNIKFINNIVTMQAPGTAVKSLLYLATPASVIESNHNVLWAKAFATQPAPAISFANNVSYTSLAAWQAAAGTPDANSLSADPDFTSPLSGNFIPRNVAINNTGLALQAVTDDFVGVTRHAVTPDAGAYEWSIATGLASETETQQVTIWPNPFTTDFTIRFVSPANGQIKVAVYDNIGKVVRHTTASKSAEETREIKVSTADLPSGFYIVTLETETGRISKKLIKL